MNYSEFLENVDKIITVNKVETPTINYRFVDFIKNNNEYKLDEYNLDTELTNTINKSEDFTELYNSIITSLYECSLENKFDADDENIQNGFNKPITETDSSLKLRKLTTRILSVSNYIAVTSRIGAGQTIIYNSSNKEDFNKIIEKDYLSKYTIIENDAVPVNTVCVCRKSFIDSCGVFLFIHENDDTIYYDVIKAGVNYSKQFINFKY